MAGFKRVPTAKIADDKKNAVFLAIYAKEISPWKYFQDEYAKHIKCPAVIMIDRWDGRSGFPGGTLNDGETLMEALKREIKEEIGIHIREDKIFGVSSFDYKLRTHLFAMEVIEMEFMHIYYHILNNFSRSILLHAYKEGDDSHFMSEITGIKIVPIIDIKGKGIKNFLQNNFAGATKEDLKIFLSEILDFKYT